MSKALLRLGGLGGLLALCTIGAVVSAQARDFPKRPYDATYTTTSPTGTTAMRLACDGKGHILNEVQASTYQMTSILDFPANVCLIIRPAQKQVMKMPLTEEQASAYDEGPPKKQTGKSLGSKVVDGHPCKGWQYASPDSGGNVETWQGDDIHLAVKTITTMKSGGTVTTTLKTYSPKAPPDSAFAVPAGYSVTALPTSPPRP